MWVQLMNQMGGLPQQRKPNWQNLRHPDKNQKQLGGNILDAMNKYPQATPQIANQWLRAYHAHPDTIAKKTQRLNTSMRDWVQNYYRRR